MLEYPDLGVSLFVKFGFGLCFSSILGVFLVGLIYIHIKLILSNLSSWSGTWASVSLRISSFLLA